MASAPEEYQQDMVQCFKPDPGCPDIPIRGRYEFTRRWFKNRNQKTWSKYFIPRFKDPIRILQIGVFEGADLIWCIENLTVEKAVAIDPWAATRKLPEDHMEGVRLRAARNLNKACSKYGTRLTIHHGFSQHILPDLSDGEDFDLAVIDGDHMADAVYSDAQWVLPLMKIGGWMVFDDVRQRRWKPGQVYDGLQYFLEDYRYSNPSMPQVEPIWKHRFSDCLRVVDPVTEWPQED